MQYAAIFVIMKCYNGSMGYRYNMDPDGWHFDGTTHFAEKEMESFNNKYDWILYNANGTDYILGDTYNKISSILRQENFSGRSYSGKKSKIDKYNIDDYRFWENEDFFRVQKSGFK
jgi:hypothetical protein